MHTVVSVFIFEIRETKPGVFPSTYIIPASDGIFPQVGIVDDGKHFIYLDETRGSQALHTPSGDIAKAIVADFCQGQLGVDDEAKPGLAYLAGVWTSADLINKQGALLKELKDQQMKWFSNICRIADTDWRRYHQHNVISDLQRRAAQILQWDPKKYEWMDPNYKVETNNCPACGFAVPEGVAVCSQCRCVVDKEKFSQLTFA